LVVITRCGGDETKSGDRFKGTWNLRNGDEDVVTKG
jgi:hypothetical protein